MKDLNPHSKVPFAIQNLLPSNESRICLVRSDVQSASMLDLINLLNWYKSEVFDAWSEKMESEQRERIALERLEHKKISRDEDTDDDSLDPHGFVYLLKSGNAYKIGVAHDVSARLTNIRPIMPYPVELIHAVESQECWLLEKSLHQRFAEKRLNGEWFDLSPQDIEYIKGL